MTPSGRPRLAAPAPVACPRCPGPRGETTARPRGRRPRPRSPAGRGRHDKCQILRHTAAYPVRRAVPCGGLHGGMAEGTLSAIPRKEDLIASRMARTSGRLVPELNCCVRALAPGSRPCTYVPAGPAVRRDRRRLRSQGGRWLVPRPAPLDVKCRERYGVCGCYRREIRDGGIGSAIVT
jgi:hypothetical protein